MPPQKFDFFDLNEKAEPAKDVKKEVLLKTNDKSVIVFKV